MKGLFKLFKKGGKQEPSQTQEQKKDQSRLEDVKSKIFPYFKKFQPSTDEALPFPDDASEIDREKVYEVPQLQLVQRTIAEGLHLLYAIDNDYGYEIIQERIMADWGLTEAQLFEIAKDNFNNLMAAHLKGHGDSNGMMLTVDGNLEAGLVLMDSIWEQLELQIEGTLVIAVPSRDVVLVTGENKSEFLSDMRQKAREVYEKASHPISDLLYKRIDGKWEVFEKL